MYAILYIGLASDMLLNFWTLTVLYLEWPREILSTSRVKRWAKLSGYRKRLSWFFAMEYLLPVDPRHMDD
jgi:hypothetical protein